MNILGNLIWLIFGGIIIFLEYIIAGVVMMLTIIGIPWGLQCFKLGVLALWPFGSEVRETQQAAGCLNTILNIIWILVGGIWIRSEEHTSELQSLMHISYAVFCLKKKIPPT